MTTLVPSFLDGSSSFLQPLITGVIISLDSYYLFSDSFSILGLWVLGLPVSHINESSCKLMGPEHYF